MPFPAPGATPDQCLSTASARTSGNRGKRKVAFVATSYPSSLDDWKGLFIRHLLYALSDRPELALSLFAPPGEMPDTVASIHRGDDAAWLTAVSAAGGIAHLLRANPLKGAFTGFQLVRRIRRALLETSPYDVYHLNWLQTALALPDDGTPALVTVLGTDLKLLGLPLVAHRLRRTFAHRAVVLCPNADWMVPPLRTAFGDRVTILPIPFGVDSAWFAIERRPGADPERWLAVTRLTRDKLGPLFEWCAPLFCDAGTRRELHLFGPMQDAIPLPEWVHWHGPATPEALRETWFPEACGLISLSRHAEGRPQVMLEAMAAGLPIVASRLPAHSDLLAGGGGLLCDDPLQLEQAIRTLSDSDENARIGRIARDRAASSFGTWADCADRYCRVYARLTGAGG